MLSNRLYTQQYIEKMLGCVRLDQWHQYNEQFKKFTINENSYLNLKAAARKDGISLYYKGMVSFLQGILDLQKGFHSWATIKFYYSVFYFLRASLAFKNHLIIRNKGLYLLEIRVGRSPVKKSGKGDHQTTIKIYQDLFGSVDILSSNQINETPTYQWLLDRREEVNYRQRVFVEPNLGRYYRFLDSKNALLSKLEYFIGEEYHISCFDADFACLALPFKRALFTHSDAIKAQARLSKDTYLALNKLIRLCFGNNIKLKSEFDIKSLYE